MGHTTASTVRVFILHCREVARIEGGYKGSGEMSGIGGHDVKFTKNQ